jgi:salicylate hydroxylase
MGERRTIIIAGAGIGGLTAALAVAAAGFRAIVVERASELSELGAGIQLSPNAGRVLAALGLDAAIAARSVEPVAIDVRSGVNGRTLVSIPARKWRERYRFPYRVIHRADLQAIMTAAIGANPAITLRLAATVGDFVPQAGGYLVRIERKGGREIVPVAAVIGADGVWSSVRDKIRGSASPRPSTRTAWRALIAADNAPASLPTDRIGLWLGRGAHLVHYPVAGGAAINVVAIVEEEWTKKGWNAPGEAKWLAARFAAWPEDARRAVAAAFTWQKWAIVTVDAAGSWVDGPIALLGDAAHAMAPFVAQGAAMAIEDAASLGRLLAVESEVPVALKAYESERKQRVLRVARAARRTGDAYHWGPPLSYLRDAALGLVGQRLVLGMNDWIYRWGTE